MKLIDNTIGPMLRLPRTVKRIAVLCLDASLCVTTVWLGLYLRLGEFVALSGLRWPAAAVSLVALPIFVRFGLYRAVFRYVGPQALAAITNAVLAYGAIYFSVFTLFGIPGVPRTLGIIQPILLLVAIGGSRVVGRYWLSGRYREFLRRPDRDQLLIYGAGSAGQQLAAAIGDSRDMHVIGFLDDDESLHGSVIGGKTVYSPQKMADLVSDYDVSEILLAIPSATRRRRSEILDSVRSVSVSVRTLPGIMDVARGSVTVTDLRAVEIEDLLGRDPVTPDMDLMEMKARGKIVLVTGAGGSIGSELCRQILKANPSTLLLAESSEFALYQIQYELERQRSKEASCATAIYPLLGSVTDQVRMREIFTAWRPQTVYHAAAFKHVPLVEHNIVEGVRNNVLGTWNCAQIAHDVDVDDFVLISTDKAVRPTNVMGASKRLAELGLQALAGSGTGTCFSMVRFGNVLGSSGSVVPLFREQIRRGGPLTVTDPRVTRYFMTIREAAELVIQAGAMAKGGEVFVLDMGNPVKVLDLATNMIALSGMRIRTEQEPDGDIEVVFTGLRPGEKLFEELLIGNDPASTSHPRIMMANESFIPLHQLTEGIERLRRLVDAADPVATRQCLADLVAEYRPADDIVDYLAGRGSHANLHIVKSASRSP